MDDYEVLQLLVNGIIGATAGETQRTCFNDCRFAILLYPKKTIVRCNVKVNDPCNQDTTVTRMTSGPLVIHGVLMAF